MRNPKSWVIILISMVVVLTLSSCTSRSNRAPYSLQHSNSPYVLNKKELIYEREGILNPKYQRLLVVYVEGTAFDVDEEEEFWAQSLRNMGNFLQVKSAHELDAALIQHAYKNDTLLIRVHGMEALKRLQKVYGPFLVARVSSNCTYGNWNWNSVCSVTFKVVDPMSDKLFFFAQRVSTLNFIDSMEDNIHYPILNAFYAWIKRNQSL